MKNRAAIPALFLLIITIFPVGANPTTTPRTIAYTTTTSLGPTAAFTYNPCVMCAVPGDLVMFDASPSRTTASAITLYTWNFGDNSATQNMTSPSINHDYFGYPSKWIVTLTVTDNNKHTDTISQLVIFLIHPVFTYHPTIPAINQQVLLNATTSTSYNSTSPILAYQWTFGDGTTGIGKITTHAYTAPGQYRITLQLTTSDGNPQVSETIFVGILPTSQIIFQGTFQNINVTVTGTINHDSTTHTLTANLSITAVNDTSGQTLFAKNENFSATYAASTQNPRFIVAIPLGTLTLGLGCAFRTDTGTTFCVLSKNPDLDNDGKIDIFDMGMIELAYGSTPGSPHWNLNADLADHNTVDLIDASIAELDYGFPVFY